MMRATMLMLTLGRMALATTRKFRWEETTAMVRRIKMSYPLLIYRTSPAALPESAENRRRVNQHLLQQTTTQGWWKTMKRKISPETQARAVAVVEFCIGHG